MDGAVPIDENALIEGQNGAPAAAASTDDLSWAVVKMRAGERIAVNEALIADSQAGSSPHSIRAVDADRRLRLADIEILDSLQWCQKLLPALDIGRRLNQVHPVPDRFDGASETKEVFCMKSPSI